MFIVIEGLDGCGKSTQLDLLKNNYKNADFITFPYYETKSGMIVRDYLDGKFNETSSEISAYSASLMYALDRYTNFKTHWQTLYEKRELLISARYTSSNTMYQMTKLPKNEWDNYLNWLYDLEYVKLGLPKPDVTIFLDMPIEISQKMLSNRYNGDESKKDIHESNIGFLNECRLAAHYVANRENWMIIDCSENGKPKSIENIYDELTDLIEIAQISTNINTDNVDVTEEISDRKCFQCTNYTTSSFCGYNAAYCKIYGSLDMDQHERHPDTTAKTCPDYKLSPFMIKPSQNGYWIKRHESINLGEHGFKEWDNFFCSECDYPNDRPSKFCPECGSKMKKIE